MNDTPKQAEKTVRTSGRARQSGMALATVLMLTLVLALVAVSTLSLMNNLLRSTERRTDQVEALNMADSGLDLAVSWLQAQPSPPDDTQLHPLNNFYGTTGTISAPFGVPGSQLIVAIYADANNPGPTQKKYVVESKAVMPSGVTKVVRAYIQQVSFGKYAFFADIDDDGFYDFHNHFEGPFHSNGADGGNSTFLWTNPPPEGPIFTYNGDDAFSSSRPVTWWKDTIGNVVAPITSGDFSAIASGGLTSMTYGWKTDINGNTLYDASGNPIPKSPVINLPQTDYLQAYVSLGLTPPGSPSTLPSTHPTTPGVTVTSGGGIYIHGQSQVTLSVDGSGNQVFTVVTQNNGNTQTQTVTVNSGSTSTTVRTQVTNSVGLPLSDTTATVNSLPNGLVFADDNITSLSGTIANNRTDASGNVTYRNQWTIATDTGAGKNVTISDSIRYQTARQTDASGAMVAQTQDSNFNTKAGTLGVLSHDVSLRDGAPSQIEVDAMMFCTGSYKAANAWSSPGWANGRMKNIGGVIVERSGIFAYADGGGNLVAGWQEEYHYDIRMADYPPPYFPTTGNHYKVVSWQIVPGTIQ